MGVTVSDEMVRVAHAEYHKVLGDAKRSDPMRAALEAALGAMWRTDFENAPFMGPVLLAIHGRKLPIAVFRHNKEGPWRYLESGSEVQSDIAPTYFMPLPDSPTLPSGET